MSVPQINYREMAQLILDRLDSVRHPHLHICLGCFSKALSEYVEPAIGLAVSHGKQLHKEELMNDLVNGEKR